MVMGLPSWWYAVTTCRYELGRWPVGGRWYEKDAARPRNGVACGTRVWAVVVDGRLGLVVGGVERCNPR